ncbi:Protein HypA [Thelohanellus kitauei]|uniref:Protein HypA n=1 Tax=Thelohanellus kitauei TaxID=669202 RepID=A0A0C2MYW5_THEKT|nr:Protein HypA [Thelohanellus kitauei]
MSSSSLVSSRFTAIATFSINEIAKGHYYESTFSGIHVMVAEIEGPKIDGYIGFGTKIGDNSGVAHTLEHLVFCGSKKYPYKGILDSLANRCFAQGTNAWTCIDSTVYTISTASQEGFINILPVYMDHIFNPVINEDTFKTEVYSKSEEGEEGGVVFSEMQAKENSEECLVFHQMMMALFQPETGYPFVSGGTMKRIRELNIAKIIQFHKKFYRPENCLIAVIGAIDNNKILDAIMKIEDEFFADTLNEIKIERPFVNQEIPEPVYGTYEVLFESTDKSKGTLIIVMPGPYRQALNVLASYLTYFDNSPLKKQIVDYQKLCTDIQYTIYWYDKTYLRITFTNVDVKNFDKVIETYKTVMNQVLSNDLDKTLLDMVMKYEYSWEFNNFEQNPHDLMAHRAIDYFLYGKTALNFIDIMERIRNYKDIFEEDNSFWNTLVKTYFNPEKLVIIKSVPKNGRRLPRQETLMIEDKIDVSETYHPIKLRKKPPQDLLEKIPIPNINDVAFHPIKTLCNFGAFDFGDTTLYDFNIVEVPLAIHADHINSNTMTVTLCSCVGTFPANIRHYIPLASFFPLEMPVFRKGVLLPHDNITKELDRLFFNKFSSIGWNSGRYNLGILTQYFFISLKTDIFHYEDAVTWIRDLLFNYSIDPVILKKLILEDYRSAKSVIDNGLGAVYGLSNFITFKKDSINYIQSVYVQLTDLQNFYKRLKEDPKKLIEDFTKVQASFSSHTNIIAHLACNFEKLSHICRSPHSVWQLNFTENAQYESRTPLTPSHFNFNQIEETKFYKKIIRLAASESCFLIQTIPSIKSYRNADFPGLLVFLEFLSAFEGPLWKKLRGNGLAYTSLIFCEPSDGLIYFKIFKSTDIVNAYIEAIKVMKSYIDGETMMMDHELDSAISGVIFEIVNQENHVSDAALSRMLSQLKGYDYEFQKELINNVTKVTVKDIQELAKKHLLALTDPQKTHVAISCPQKDLEKIMEGFKNINIELEIFQRPPFDDALMQE